MLFEAATKFGGGAVLKFFIYIAAEADWAAELCKLWDAFE